MSDTNLRGKLIRLAKEHPEFRKDILPLLKEAGCEKLPEGGMRDNCEEKKEEGKDKKAWIDSNNLNAGSIANNLRYLAKDLQDKAELITYNELRPIVKALRLQMSHLDIVLGNLASRR